MLKISNENMLVTMRVTAEALTQMQISGTDVRTSLMQQEERTAEGRLHWPTFFNKKQPIYFINEKKMLHYNSQWN